MNRQACPTMTGRNHEAWVSAVSAAFAEIDEIGAIVAHLTKAGPEWPDKRQGSQKNSDSAPKKARQAINAKNSTGEVSHDQ